MRRPDRQILPRAEDRPATAASRGEFRRLAILGWAVLLLTGWFLAAGRGRGPAGQWLLQAGLLWALVLVETRRFLPLNRRDAQTAPYSHLGLANRLTLLRGGLIACAGGFLFQDAPQGALAFLPAGFYALSAIIDRLDGYAARRTGQVSQMGTELDTVFDALGLAIAPLLAVWYGKIHWSYLLVSCAYYLFQWGQRYRRNRGLPLFPLEPKLSRRAIAGFQMGFIAVVLFPMFQPPATRIAGFAFMLPVLSGFLIDWLVVSGRISDQSWINHQRLARGETLLSAFTQPLSRLILAGLLPAWAFHVTENLSAPLPGGALFLAALLGCGALILLGILGRSAALVLILLIGMMNPSAPGPSDGLILALAIWLLVLGTGRFSLCSRDEDWVNRYDGAA